MNDDTSLSSDRQHPSEVQGGEEVKHGENVRQQACRGQSGGVPPGNRRGSQARARRFLWHSVLCVRHCVLALPLSYSVSRPENSQYLAFLRGLS